MIFKTFFFVNPLYIFQFHSCFEEIVNFNVTAEQLHSNTLTFFIPEVAFSIAISNY